LADTHRSGATNPRQGAYNPARPSGFPDLSRECPMAYNLLRQGWQRTRPFGWGASPGAPHPMTDPTPSFPYASPGTPAGGGHMERGRGRARASRARASAHRLQYPSLSLPSQESPA